MPPAAQPNVRRTIHQCLLEAIGSLEYVSIAAIPSALGTVEELRASLWRKMLAPPIAAPTNTEVTPFMTVAEVARVLRFSRGHVYELIRSGDLLAVKNGRAVRVTPDALSAWQARHQRASLDSYSASLESVRDRRPNKAAPPSLRPDASRVREASRRLRRRGREVRDGRATAARSDGAVDRLPRRPR